MSFDEVIKVLICVFEDFADNEPMNLVELDPFFLQGLNSAYEAWKWIKLFLTILLSSFIEACDFKLWFVQTGKQIEWIYSNEMVNYVNF